MQTTCNLGYDQLNGWAADDLAAAFTVFRATLAALTTFEWDAIRVAADVVPDARAFFEEWFVPVLIGPDTLFTGYYEPELDGSLIRDVRFTVPVHALPAGLPAGPWLTRQQIEESGALAGCEICWIEAPLDRFFLQVQGCGRIRLADGRVIRLGFAGRNGHPYRSVGAELIARGVCASEQMSMQVIRDWAAQHPVAVQSLLWCNPGYVFFREVTGIAPEQGPIGALGLSVSPLRSLAVDPAHVPLAAPVWIETEGLHCLMVAQDTGSAIKGPNRADVFCGTGAEAGARAGAMRDPGRMIALLPRALVV